MILNIKDIIREINIQNWYRGEAVKRNDENADKIQTNESQLDIQVYYLKSVVTDVLLLANSNRVKFTCDYMGDQLKFSIEPVREGREYMLEILKEAIRQYIVYEVRRLWMMTVRPEWADSSLRESLRENIQKAINDSTSTGNRVRRRYAPFGI